MIVTINAPETTSHAIGKGGSDMKAPSDALETAA